MTTEPVGGSILVEAHALVHGARNVDYSHPLDDFSCTAALLNAMFADRLISPFVAEDVALVQIAVKLSRELRHHKRDNLVDLAGYAETREMVLSERGRRSAAGDHP